MPPHEHSDILLIDDHVDVREALAEVLHQQGYAVTSVSSATEALSLLKFGARPKLILLDLEMPTLSGWGFCSNLTEDPELRNIPIAIITAVPAYRGVPHRLVDAGIFRKPIDIDALLETVNAYVPVEKTGSG